MKLSEREIARRLAALEDAESVAVSAFVDVIRADGTKKRMLWVDALLNVLDGSEKIQGEQVASVEGGELAGLITAMLPGSCGT